MMLVDSKKKRVKLGNKPYKRIVPLLGTIIGQFKTGNYLLRHKDGNTYIELFPDTTTIVLSKINWSEVTIYGENSPLKTLYYGRLSKVKKYFEGFNKIILKEKHTKNIIQVHSTLWVAAVRYCYYKGYSPIIILKKAGIGIKHIERFFTNNGVSITIINSASYFIAALNTDVESLLMWHFQSYGSMQINVPVIMQRFFDDINATNEAVEEANKKSVTPISVQDETVKSMPDQGLSDVIDVD